MKATTRSLLLLTVIVAASVVAAADAAPPVPPTPAGVRAVLHAQPFFVDEAYPHRLRKDAPPVTAGYLLVLEVDPALVYPRQRHEPVLYVGKETARRLNVGYTSGRVVAIVPAPREERDGAERVALDLRRARIWFGTPELPERVDRARVDFEDGLAADAGIRPLPAAQIARALAEGGGTTARLASRDEVLRAAARLVKRYSPDEAALADGFLLPVAKKPAP